MYFVKIRDSIVAFGLTSELEAYAVVEQWVQCFPDLIDVISICKVISCE